MLTEKYYSAYEYQQLIEDDGGNKSVPSNFYCNPSAVIESSSFLVSLQNIR